MARRRIGQWTFGFGDGRGHWQSSLDELLQLIDRADVERHPAGISAAAKGEPAWPPLALFKAMLIAVWHDLSESGLPKPWMIEHPSDGFADSHLMRQRPGAQPLSVSARHL